MKASRIAYTTPKRPRLFTGAKYYEISDISEMGLRFYKEGKIQVGHRIFGKVIFLCGESIDIEGMVVRKDRIHIHMNINTPIEKTILKKEQAYLNDNLDERIDPFNTP